MKIDILKVEKALKEKPYLKGVRFKIIDVEFINAYRTKGELGELIEYYKVTITSKSFVNYKTELYSIIKHSDNTYDSYFIKKA